MEDTRAEQTGKKGLVHIYCGDGKGKTTAGMGLCARAAGAGLKVLICQFMKDNTSGERECLSKAPRIVFMPGQDKVRFSFLMTEPEKQEQREFYAGLLCSASRRAAEEGFDVLLLDEAVYAVRAGLLDESLLTEFLDRRPEKLEVILTGQDPGEALLERADYISEIRKIRHPYDRGIAARAGIER